MDPLYDLVFLFTLASHLNQNLLRLIASDLLFAILLVTVYSIIMLLLLWIEHDLSLFDLWACFFFLILTYSRRVYPLLSFTGRF